MKTKFTMIMAVIATFAISLNLHSSNEEVVFGAPAVQMPRGGEKYCAFKDDWPDCKMAIEGTCDIGMASRALKDSEIEGGVSPTVIAIDGIAVIANLASPIVGLTAEQVRSIYVGETTNWADVQ